MGYRSLDYGLLVSSAWFGLIGVVVGGLISTLWSWLAVVRQELSEAMVAARLVDEDLRSAEALVSGTGAARADLDRDVWAANRVALAKVLGHPQWNALVEVYRRGARTSYEPGDSFRQHLSVARASLDPLVRGKRYVPRQRWGNWLDARRRPRIR